MVRLEILVVAVAQRNQGDARLAAAVVRPGLLHQVPVAEEAGGLVIEEPAAQINQIRSPRLQCRNHMPYIMRRIIVVVIELHDELTSRMLDENIALGADWQFSAHAAIMDILLSTGVQRRCVLGAVIEDEPLNILMVLTTEIAQRLPKEAAPVVGGGDDADHARNLAWRR